MYHDQALLNSQLFLHSCCLCDSLTQCRNQRMADDQSVVGRRQIYYDQDGGETLICSDSEGEVAEPEEEKHGFSEAEDQILWYCNFLSLTLFRSL